MKKTGLCPKCGSNDIIADALAIDRGDANGHLELSLAADRHPEALFFKGRHMTAVSAWVCGECGFTEFYADKPYMLKVGGKYGSS